MPLWVLVLIWAWQCWVQLQRREWERDLRKGSWTHESQQSELSAVQKDLLLRLQGYSLPFGQDLWRVAGVQSCRQMQVLRRSYEDSASSSRKTTSKCVSERGMLRLKEKCVSKEPLMRTPMHGHSNWKAVSPLFQRKLCRPCFWLRWGWILWHLLDIWNKIRAVH